MTGAHHSDAQAFSNLKPLKSTGVRNESFAVTTQRLEEEYMIVLCILGALVRVLFFVLFFVVTDPRFRIIIPSRY